MAKKKSSKGQAKPKKRFAPKQSVKVKEIPMSFFQRLKDVLPEQKKETVRVKTFIVEKPVYVSAPERVLPPAQKYNLSPEDARHFDSRKSRYAKRRAMQEEAEAEGIEDSEEVAPVRKGKRQVEDEFSSVDDEPLPEGEEEMGEVDENGDPIDEEAGEESIDETGEEMPLPGAPTHTRSHAMFINVWWKKALFWAILLWLIILLLELAMQMMKLIEVDLTRQWWVVLAGLIVILMIYFKFFEGKINI